MAKFDSNLNSLDELTEMFDNMQKQVNSFKGTLNIDINKIKENLDSFNHDFDTNFSLGTSNEEYQEYFNDEYISFMQEHLTDNVDYKQHFNDVYLGYAHID